MTIGWRGWDGIRGRRWLTVTIPFAVILLAVYAVAFIVDEPLRRYTEAKMNRALQGYRVRLEAVSFHPLGFSLDLTGLTVVQAAHPSPPVAEIAWLRASVHWRALLHGRVVGDMFVDRPRIYVNLAQARQEIADPTPLRDRGWREALEAIYPLKVNEFRVRGGDVTYRDEGPFRPLRVRDLDLVATNIRNVRSGRNVYPSEFRLRGRVFEEGRVEARGQADFLADPRPIFRGQAVLHAVELDYFKPITNRYNLAVERGRLSTTGSFELGPAARRIELEEARIDGVRIDYVHSARTARIERTRVKEAQRLAGKAANAPDLLVRIGTLRIVDGTFGFVNQATTPAYRVFISDTDATLTNLTNQASEGTATLRLHGKGMGAGRAALRATIRAERGGPAGAVDVQVADVDMPAMNDLWRAYGNFDVTTGSFNLYSELRVANGAISGYVKPLFRGVTVYDARQDEDKSFPRRIYERIVDGAGRLLKNRARGEVATRAEISGRLDDPEVSKWEVTGRLIENAFFKAILPGLERQARRTPP